MRNTNTREVLTIVEKQLPEVKGLWYPKVITAYDEWEDTFTIADDPRYDHEGRDTAWADHDDVVIPAYMIFAITGADTDYEDPHAWVGHRFLMPGHPHKV